VTYDVQFSLEAAAELVRIAGAIGSAASVLQAAERIRHTLEIDPGGEGEFLVWTRGDPFRQVQINPIRDGRENHQKRDRRARRDNRQLPCMRSFVAKSLDSVEREFLLNGTTG